MSGPARSRVPPAATPGLNKRRAQGWFAAHRWLLARRVSQLGILALFLLGPLFGLWVVTGNLSASLTLNMLPLTDPLLLAQSLLSGAWPVLSGAIGALIVLVFYALVGGRVFCSWVCPVNLASDAAAWARRRLGLHGGARLSPRLRLWLLALVLLFPLVSGVMAWEYVNPVSLTHRGLIFGSLAGVLTAATALLAVFLFDLFVARRGWCGHLCPVGAFYGLLGARALVRVSAAGRERCDDCMDCYSVCPEPQVIKPALKGAPRGLGPVIRAGDCTNCGRCIDVCGKQVFGFRVGLPFDRHPRTADSTANPASTI